jgi:hypothetical protein
MAWRGDPGRKMAEILVLKPWQPSPKSGDRIAIVRDAKACMMTTWRDTSVIPHRECWPLDQTLDHPREEAEMFGIGTIYVRGLGLQTALKDALDIRRQLRLILGRAPKSASRHRVRLSPESSAGLLRR